MLARHSYVGHDDNGIRGFSAEYQMAVFRPARLGLALLLTVAFATALTVDAAAQQLAFDHVWIRVTPGAPEAEALRKAGLHVAPITRRHTGMGTASVFVFFRNTCLELIWVEDAGALIRSAPQFAHTLLGGTGASPFGIGLRRLAPDVETLPFVAEHIVAEWIRPGNSLRPAPVGGLAPTVPSIFVVPPYMAVAGRQAEFAEFMRHDFGTREVTLIQIRGPGLSSDAAAVRTAVDQGIAAFVPDDTHLLELEFDSGLIGRRLDFRPTLPLVILY